MWQDARSADCLRYTGTRPDASGNPGVFLWLLSSSSPASFNWLQGSVTVHALWLLYVEHATKSHVFKLISLDLPLTLPLPCPNREYTASRHTTAALQLNSFPREMKGSRDRGRNRAVRAQRERDVTGAGQLTGWILPVDQVEVSGLLLILLCILETWWIEALSKKNLQKGFQSHWSPSLYNPSSPSPVSVLFLLYLSLSPSVYLRSPPYCSESWFSLSKWLDCFSAGEFTSDVYTEAWTGPQAMPDIDFTMILIRGLPVAIDTHTSVNCTVKLMVPGRIPYLASN